MRKKEASTAVENAKKSTAKKSTAVENAKKSTAVENAKKEVFSREKTVTAFVNSYNKDNANNTAIIDRVSDDDKNSIGNNSSRTSLESFDLIHIQSNTNNKQCYSVRTSKNGFKFVVGMTVYNALDDAGLKAVNELIIKHNIHHTNNLLFCIHDNGLKLAKLLDKAVLATTKTIKETESKNV